MEEVHGPSHLSPELLGPRSRAATALAQAKSTRSSPAVMRAGAEVVAQIFGPRRRGRVSGRRFIHWRGILALAEQGQETHQDAGCAGEQRRRIVSGAAEHRRSRSSAPLRSTRWRRFCCRRRLLPEHAAAGGRIVNVATGVPRAEPSRCS